MRGRYSIIGMNPDLIWRSRAAQAAINRKARTEPDGPFEPIALAAACSRFARCSPKAASSLPEDAPPMAAGVFGYLGYDMVRLMEDLPAPNPDTLGLPDARADPPHHHGDLRQRARRGHRHLAGLCRARRYRAKRRLCAGARSGIGESSMRSTGRSTIRRCRTTDAPPIRPPRSNTTPGGIQGDGR